MLLNDEIKARFVRLVTDEGIFFSFNEKFEF